jgi:hypothetical protein
MRQDDIEILVFVVSAFTLFGGVLGWASWMEGREAKYKVQGNSELKQNTRQRARAF